MENNGLRENLERASEVLLASPDVVSAQQRRDAEHVFITFQHSQASFEVCKNLLETSQNDYILFHAVTALRDALIRDWPSLGFSQIESVHIYLMNFVVERLSLQAYIREQIVQTIAVIHKRSTLDSDKSRQRSDDRLFTDIARLIHTGGQSSQLVACSLLSSLLSEYSNGARMSRVGLTWEQHCRCKITFEQHDMKQVLIFCVQTLAALLKCCCNSHVDRHLVVLLSRLLAVIEQIFSWEFAQQSQLRRHVGYFAGSQAVSFRPPASWADLVLDRSLADMLFMVHRNVCDVPEVSHQSLQCLAQLGSMSGAVFTNSTLHVDYIGHFIRSFLQLSQSKAVRPHQALDVANVIFSVVTYCPMSVITQLPSDVATEFFSYLSRITCDFCRAAADESERSEESLYFEAFDKVLESWMKFVEHVSDLPINTLLSHAVEIFNAFIHCHLAQPDGSRSVVAGDCDHEYGEMEDDDDQDKFSYQLLAVSTLARLVADYSLPLLTKLLEERVSRLKTMLAVLQRGQILSVDDQRMLDSVNEDLHWLLLIAADTLADGSTNGETVCIPSSVARCSPSTLTGNMTTLLRSRIVDSVDDVEPVVKIVATVFHLCSAEMAAIDAGLGDHLSPQVSRSLARVLCRWTCSYLFPDLSCYEQLSSELGITLSRGSDADICWTVTYLLNYVTLCLKTRSSELALINDVLELFAGLVNTKERCSVSVRCEALWHLARCCATNDVLFNKLSPSSRRQLCRCLMLPVIAKFDDGRKDTYMQLVMQSAHSKLRTIVGRHDLQTVHSKESVKQSVLLVLDSLCGMAEAVRVDSALLLFSLLCPSASDAVTLLDVYHNYSEVVEPILQLFSIITSQLLCYLSEKDCRHLYNVTLSMMQTFAKYNIGRNIVSREDMEEEQFSAVLTLMEILTNLLSKDFLSFAADDPDDACQVRGSDVSAADVVLYGLNIIVPLMNAELLKFPALFSTYAALLAYMAEIHVSRLCRLPDDLLHHLMAAVDLGLTSNAGPDVAKACLELVASLAAHVCMDPSLHGTTAYQVGAHFLEVIVQMLLMDTFDMDLLETASSAFFALICSHRSRYQELVSQLLSTHANSSYCERLAKAFTALTGPIDQLTYTRTTRVQFMHNLEQFLVDVRAFLCVR